MLEPDTPASMVFAHHLHMSSKRSYRYENYLKMYYSLSQLTSQII